MTTANPTITDFEFQVTPAESSSDQDAGSSLTRVRYRAQDRVDLTAQLAMMVGAGVSLTSALKSVRRQTRRQAMTRLLDRLIDDLHGGASLSVAMGRHPAMFDTAYVSTVAAGEASGKMNEVLTGLADMLRSEAELRRTLRGMMIYPMVLTLVSLAVITALVLFVLPQFDKIFTQYELALPTVTTFLLGISDELRQRWWLWGVLTIGAVAGLISMRFSQSGRRLYDTAMLSAPGLRFVNQRIIGARACRMMGLLLLSGVPLLDCLNLLKRAIPNQLFQDLADKMKETVTNGHRLSEAFEGNIALPESAAEMIATAEKTGRLGEVATVLGTHYEVEARENARQLVSAIEPILTIAMGGIVATVVLAVMLPIFDIASLAQQ